MRNLPLNSVAVNTRQPLISRLVFVHWSRVLTLFFTGLFLFQIVQWIMKEPYIWLPETAQYIQVTLVLVFFMELLFYRLGAFRFPLQGIAVMLYTASVVEYAAPSRIPGVEITMFDRIAEWFQLLHPFIWFTMSAWLIYLFAQWWLQVRWRIFIAMVLTVLVMAFRDSFSPIVLWGQVAVVILCGLCLLIIQHLMNVKRRNPIGWSYLADYPASLAFPIVLLLFVAIVPSMFAPNIGNLLTDPYTLWKTWRGEPVNFSSNGQNSFQLELDSSSGYSRNDEMLGGGFNFDYSPVMSVQTSHRSYWRGETRSLYTGNGWEKSNAERQSPLRPVDIEAPLYQDSRFNMENRKTIEVTQTITMLNEQSYPILFGAHAMVELSALPEGLDGDRVLWSPRSAELLWSERGGTYPSTYTVISEIPVNSEDELRQAPPADPNAFADYLQLPDTLPERVRELAREITAEASTPYDQAKALEQYLQFNYSYTNTPNDNGTDDMDFVDRFLFEIEEGYCDYFSTAMTVMARTLDLPARWVKGFSTGSPQLYDPEMIPYEELGFEVMEAGVYNVLNSNAHSWVEVYFEGYGWIPFEPTSGFIIPVHQEESDAGVLPQTDPPETTLPEPQSPAAEEGGARTWLSVAAMIAGLLVLAGLLLWVYKPSRMKLKALLTSEKSYRNFNEMIIMEYHRLIRMLQKKGQVVHEHETARETIQRWMQSNHGLSQDLQQFLLLFEKAKYGKSAITEEESIRAASIIQKIRESTTS
ncbi:transglutaminase TgpA family protein [Paenibacillus senegalensis]|uniref:transglutaminase TgpA family protein n=1 Tax=Paenibacillus senegalensis TaxID=1465766 RepID=UPI00028811E4|nr:transglutaminase domain-containing protein [Paenibacillus senegalensis]